MAFGWRWRVAGRSRRSRLISGSVPRRCASACGRPRLTAAPGQELLTTGEREEIRKLRRENYELKRANEILKSASVFFAKELDADRPK